MDIINMTRETRLQSPCIAAIGMFDGVHRGHQYLLGQLTAEARSLNLSAVVITFALPPRQILTDKPSPMLTPLNEKLALLEQTGIDQVVVLPFDKQMARLTSRQFMAQVLKEQLCVSQLIVGYDNRFGSDRDATFADYAAYGRETGITVRQCEAWDDYAAIGGSRKAGDPPAPPSSSAVRRLLAEGKVEEASVLLGRPYSLCGKVVAGRQEGRKIGFPTANIDVESLKLIPKAGAYAARTGNKLGMLNIGTRPTYNEDNPLSVEFHIFDFSGDLYGQQMNVELLWRLRDEQRFESPEALRRQLEADRESIKVEKKSFCHYVKKNT